jgi:hypothetical protein
VSDRSELIHNFVSAGKRDLQPLLREAAGTLHLADGEALTVGTYMTQTWMRGAQSGHAEILAQADPERSAPDIAEIEADFRELMQESADALNLSLQMTVNMWNFLARAWIAGINSSRAETLAMALEMDSDIAEEALHWLNDPRDE